MPRIQIIVEYDGTRYAGWQRQENALTVQQVLEEKLSALTKEKIVLHWASRTDAGVHARGQSAHFDTLSRIPAEKFSFAVNTMLPEDIRVQLSREVPETFHARFSTKGKRYCYWFQVSPHASPLNRLNHAHVIYPLDEKIMQKEAADLIGKHDFAAFAASGSVVRDTVRTIYRADVERFGSEIRLTVEGSGFLYNMVRIIAGTLIGVGSGKIAPGAFARAIQTGNRLDLGVTAPAKGLTLMEVFYDPNDLVLHEVNTDGNDQCNAPSETGGR